MYPDFLPVVRHEHKLDDGPMQVRLLWNCKNDYNTHVTKQIEIDPPQARIEEHVRYTYACPKCRDGKQIITTTKPPTPLEKSPFAERVGLDHRCQIQPPLATVSPTRNAARTAGLVAVAFVDSGLLRDTAQVLQPLPNLLGNASWKVS